MTPEEVAAMEATIQRAARNPDGSVRREALEVFERIEREVRQAWRVATGSGMEFPRRGACLADRDGDGVYECWLNLGHDEESPFFRDHEARSEWYPGGAVRWPAEPRPYGWWEGELRWRQIVAGDRPSDGEEGG